MFQTEKNMELFAFVGLQRLWLPSRLCDQEPTSNCLEDSEKMYEGRFLCCFSDLLDPVALSVPEDRLGALPRLDLEHVSDAPGN